MKKTKVKFKKPSITSCVSIHRVLVGIGDNLFKLFYPVLIYNSTGSLWLAALFMFVQFLAAATSNILFKKLFYRNALIFVTINVVLTIVVQIIFTINLAFTPSLVVLIGILNGLFLACYWVPINTLFASNNGKNANKSLKTFENTSLLGKIVAPAIGGLLLGSGNMIVSLMLSIVIYSSSLVVLYFHYKQISLTFRTIELEQPQTIYKSVRKQKHMFNGYWFLYGMADVPTSYLWPLLLAVKNVSLSGIGYITSIALVAQFIAQFIASYLGEKKIWHVPASVCMVIRIGLLIAMPFMLNTGTMIMYSTVTGLLIPIYNSPPFAEYIQFSSKNNMLLNNMCDRETTIFAGKTAGSLFLLCGMALVPSLIITSVPFLFQWGFFFVLRHQEKHSIDVSPPPADYTKSTID